ncbi:MAG: hypothetical protein ACF8PG_02905, partial [Maioricimonas sp. JB045]
MTSHDQGKPLPGGMLALQGKHVSPTTFALCSDTMRQGNATDDCDLLRLRRAGLKTGVTSATSGLS